METRSVQLITNIEPTIAVELVALAEKRKCSQSLLLRNILIEYLVGKGVLTQARLAGILTGETLHLAKEHLNEQLANALAAEQ